jgi:ketosteroid isomerase-like protein
MLDIFDQRPPQRALAEDIEWIIPGEDWPLAGTIRGRAGVADAFQKASEEVPFSYPEPPEYVAQGDRVLVIGFRGVVYGSDLAARVSGLPNQET